MSRFTQIHWRKLVKILELDGAVIVGQTGDHIEMKKEGAKRRLVVPKYKNLPVFIIKNNLETAGISRKRYFELLDKV